MDGSDEADFLDDSRVLASNQAAIHCVFYALSHRRKPLQNPIVWVYGWGRRETIPPYIEACIETMFRNSDCTVRIVTPDNVHDYVEDLHPSFHLLKPPHQADVFRVNVLYRYGGMYLDADTIVLRGLSELFCQLDQVELVGANWKPKSIPAHLWQEIGVSVLGPMRPRLPFMKCAAVKQKELLDSRQGSFSRGYPFCWEELLSPIVNHCFSQHPPNSLIRDGASTWFAYVSGPSWRGGDLGYAFQPGDIPAGVELFTIANSLVPDKWKSADKDQVIHSDTVIGQLLRIALNEKRLAT